MLEVLKVLKVLKVALVLAAQEEVEEEAKVMVNQYFFLSILYFSLL